MIRRIAFHATILLAVVSAARGVRADAMAPGEPEADFAITDHFLGVDQVTDFRWLPDGSLLAIEKEGAVKLRSASGIVTVAGTFAVDASPLDERGLLGMALHPAFATNRTLFFYYSRADSIGGTPADRNQLVSIVLRPDGTLDPSTEKVLLRGLPATAYHNGGALEVGPDGKIYLGVGDTGCGGTTPGGTIANYFATCLTNDHGKILRLGLDGAVPLDNPLTGLTSVTQCGEGCATPISSALGPPRTEIWAWGFRNPWRFWFDPKTTSLWVGDVGELTYEEVTVVRRGQHHGWPFREGAHGYPITKCNDTTPGGNCVDPVYECTHGAATADLDGDCKSITAGQIVDSCTWPAEQRGRYFFADSTTWHMWSLQPTPARDAIEPRSRKDFAAFTSGPPVAMRVGPDGDLYVALHTDRIVRVGPKTPVTCPVVDASVPDAIAPEEGADTFFAEDSRRDSGGADARPAGDSTLTDGDDAATDAPSESSSGCGCRVARERPTSTFGVFGASAALMLVSLRRRGRRG
jgi:MYXO-CTERM domain-containing protein